MHFRKKGCFSLFFLGCAALALAIKLGKLPKINCGGERPDPWAADYWENL